MQDTMDVISKQISINETYYCELEHFTRKSSFEVTHWVIKNLSCNFLSNLLFQRNQIGRSRGMSVLLLGHYKYVV